MRQGDYIEDSYFVPLEVRKSPIHGYGLYSNAEIVSGTPILRFGGLIFSEAEIKEACTSPTSAIKVTEDLYLADPPNVPPSKDDFINHSCSPNTWMADDLVLIARETIAPQSELTADYCFWLDSVEYVPFGTCNCRTPFCRRWITGGDWMRIDLITRYRNHFMPFINRKITSGLRNIKGE